MGVTFGTHNLTKWYPLASFKTTPSILGESVVFGIDEVLSIP